MGKTHGQGQDFPIYTKPYIALDPPIHPQLWIQSCYSTLLATTFHNARKPTDYPNPTYFSDPQLNLQRANQSLSAASTCSPHKNQEWCAVVPTQWKSCRSRLIHSLACQWQDCDRVQSPERPLRSHIRYIGTEVGRTFFGWV